MFAAFVITALVCLVAFILVNLVFHDRFFGTIIPIIVSIIVGLVWSAGAILVICKGNVSSGVPALVIGLGMFGRAFVEYLTYRDVQDFYARWQRR